jgi:CubicO group peptidase (beta-lactamase class C family)
MNRGVADPERAAPNITDTTPENQAPTFRNQDQVWPVRVIRRGDAVRPLPPHARSLADLTFEVGDVRVSLSDFMARRRTAGLLILKNGGVALERYGMGNGPESRWTSFSTAKSITATLVGAALHDGAIGSLDDRCDLYLPQLRGSAYDSVTVRNVLRMCSGVAWSEENQPDGRSDDVGRLGRAMVSRRPGSVLDLLCTRPRTQPQGAVFNYSTGESCLLGAVVVAATGRPLADYCAETIWVPAGMEADASWQLESEDGLELGGLGVSARLRDLGRFGQLVLEDGAAFSGQRVMPTGWRDLAGQPDSAATAFGRPMPGSPAGYGYHWWALPGAPYAGGLHAGAWAPSASASTSIRPSGWSLSSRARGVSLRTATPSLRPSCFSELWCARSDRTRRRRTRRYPPTCDIGNVPLSEGTVRQTLSTSCSHPS